MSNPVSRDGKARLHSFICFLCCLDPSITQEERFVSHEPLPLLEHVRERHQISDAAVAASIYRHPYHVRGGQPTDVLLWYFRPDSDMPWLVEARAAELRGSTQEGSFYERATSLSPDL